MVDIPTGLSLLAQATGIVKDLREIDKGFDVAALKAQMADLYGTLADVKIALSDAREELHDRDKTIKGLEEKISNLSSGEACPICQTGRMKVISVRPHPTMKGLGLQERSLKCDPCGHKEQLLHDPMGLTRNR